jgi:guanine deaminase
MKHRRSRHSSDPARESHHRRHSHDDDHHHDHHHDHLDHDSKFANRPFSIATLLYLATAGGAAVCGIQDRVGSFGSGKSFDALLVNVGRDSSNPALWGMNVLGTPHHGTADTIADADIGLEEKQKIVNGWLESFLHGGDDRNIEKVYVQGRFVGGRTFRA